MAELENEIHRRLGRLSITKFKANEPKQNDWTHILKSIYDFSKKYV